MTTVFFCCHQLAKLRIWQDIRLYTIFWPELQCTLYSNPSTRRKNNVIEYRAEMDDERSGETADPMIQSKSNSRYIFQLFRALQVTEC